MAAVEAYEALRAAVVSGEPRAEGMAALCYHGMLHGLRVILGAAPVSPSTSEHCAPVVSSVVEQRELVRLLANMVLETESEAMHVY